MSKKVFIVLGLIIVVASILRLWQLGKVPASPDWDEVALGYNAYSIMQTGRDEYGKFLPIILRSFDDYKPALYAYFTIPFIFVLGLDVFAVRLVSALFGIATVIAVYFLVKELFKRREMGSEKLDNDVNNGNRHFTSYFKNPASHVALLTSFLVGISPWHIQFSRVAFESNVGVALNIFGILFFLKSFKKPWFLVLSAFTLGLNLYMYQSEKVFIPLLLTTLIYVFRKQFFSIEKKYMFISFLTFVVIALPLSIFMLTNKEALARARGVSIFSDQTLVERNAQKLVRDRENKDNLGLILDNRRVEYAKNFVSGYLSHFDLNWLFIAGDIARHHAPNMGLMYLWELPFLLIGIYSLSAGKYSKIFDKKERLFILLWFLVVPVPASITSGVPHAVRTLNFLPIFQIFSAVGIIAFVEEISNIKYQISKIHIKYFIFALYFLFFMFNFSYYLNQYFVQKNYYTSYDWQYGYEKAIPNVVKNREKYNKIIVSNQAPLDQSYMFFLFYLKYPPSLYQEETKNSSGGFRKNHKFGKYEFRPIVWEKEDKFLNLFVGRPTDFSPNANVLETVHYLDGKEAIKIVGYR